MSVGRGRVVDSIRRMKCKTYDMKRLKLWNILDDFRSLSVIGRTDKFPGLGKLRKSDLVWMRNLNSLVSTSVWWKGVDAACLDTSKSSNEEKKIVRRRYTRIIMKILTNVRFFLSSRDPLRLWRTFIALELQSKASCGMLGPESMVRGAIWKTALSFPNVGIVTF